MRISDWSSDVCSSDLIGREEKADRASDRGAEARGIAKRHQGQIDAALHVIDPGPVEAVAVAAHRERVRKRAHRVDGVDMGDDEEDGTRSEERRVWKEGVSKGRSRWSPNP